MDRLMGFDQQTIIQWAIQLFNTIVLVFALSKILYKPVRDFLHNREGTISEKIANAQELMANAEKLRVMYDEKISAAEGERLKIIDSAKLRAEALEAQILKEAKAEAEAIKLRATKEIELEKENSLDEMKKQIIDISALIAERYVLQKMDEQTGSRLLEEAIEDLGDATWLN